MDSLYWTDTNGRIYEFEASTNGGVYAWYRRISDDQSVRLTAAKMTPMSDADMLEMARAQLA